MGERRDPPPGPGSRPARVGLAFLAVIAGAPLSCEDSPSRRNETASDAGAAPDAALGAPDGSARTDAAAPRPPEAGKPDAAAPDAAETGTPPDAADAAPRGRATAAATLASVSARADVPPVTGTAEFRATRSGVDLELHMAGCWSTPPYPVTILESGDCAGAATAKTWSGGRGEDVPAVSCTGTSGTGSAYHARASALASRWTVGDGAPSDVVGHAVVVHDPLTLEPLSCGVVGARPDTVFAEEPPLDQAPLVATRAALAGSCLMRVGVPVESPSCPGDEGFVDCVSEHCDLGRCIDACAGYAPCLDAAGGECTATFACPLDIACSECTTKLWGCAIGYCADQVLCPVPTTPGGPCDQLRACCSLQGADADTCLDLFRILFDAGGDASCKSPQTDWDVIAHLAVPCMYESTPPAPASDPRPGGADAGSLGDGVAGRACASDAECGSGRCEGRAPIGIAFPGNACTGDCHEDSECGAGGVCLWLGQLEPGLCLRSCENDGDCARAGYRCIRLGDSRRDFGACYPAAEPLPGGVAGRACGSDADCDARPGSCRTELSLLSFGGEARAPAPGGYCSESCYFDADCGNDAYCVSGGPVGGLCFSRCTPGSPCRDGFDCVPDPRGADPDATACVPLSDVARDR